MIRILLVTILCSLLFSCQHSPQKNYYYLSASGSTQKQPASENITNVIGVGPIEIADYLNRSQIIYSQAGNALNVAENDYWAEPLDKGIARVITLNLIQSDSSRSFVTFPWRSDSKPRYSLRLNIHSLTRTDNEASIIATWELIDNDSKTNLQRRNFTRSTQVGSGAKALAQAYSQLLAELSKEMDMVLSKTAVAN